MRSKKRKSYYIPKMPRAIVSAKYAVIIGGKREVVFHRAGEPLKGRIEN